VWFELIVLVTNTILKPITLEFDLDWIWYSYIMY